MIKIFEKRVLMAASGFCLSLSVVAGGASAQVASPPMIARQGAPMTAAQLSAAFDSAIPMEILVQTNPLQRAAAPMTGAAAQAIGGGFGGASSGGGAQAQGQPLISPAVPGREEFVARRYASTRGEEGPARAVTAAPQGDIAPQNYGSGNLNTIYHYNDYQLLPFPVYYNPYRQIGRYLFQKSDNLWYTCTAALIHRAILITAGHCVHDGSGSPSGWNQDGYFYPAFTNRFAENNQRYGRCRTTFYSTTTGWYYNGSIQQGYDVAMALCGQLTGGTIAWSQNRLPGGALGYLGFCFLNCTMGYNFLTQVGYPGNYHNGLQMAVSQHLEETAVSGGPDFVYGTGMRGGSSGGPHIQNIGNLWDLATDPGQNTERNVIFAVTSWGYISEAFKLQGSSPISGPSNGNNARAIFNLVCAQSRAVHGNWSCSNL